MSQSKVEKPLFTLLLRQKGLQGPPGRRLTERWAESRPAVDPEGRDDIHAAVHELWLGPQRTPAGNGIWNRLHCQPFRDEWNHRPSTSAPQSLRPGTACGPRSLGDSERKASPSHALSASMPPTSRDPEKTSRLRCLGAFPSQLLGSSSAAE